MVSINGLSAVFPDNKVFQHEIKDLGRKLFSSRSSFKKMEKVYDNSGVNQRYLTQELDWYLSKHNWSERNILFKKNTISLLRKSILQTIEKTKSTTPKKIVSSVEQKLQKLSSAYFWQYYRMTIFQLFHFFSSIFQQ